jgi:hypothetical protein
MKTLKELVDAVGNNVKWVTYDPDKGLWIISYKNGLKDDEVETEDLIQFLETA